MLARLIRSLFPAAAGSRRDALAARAEAAHQTGRLDDAERDYRETLALDPAHPGSLRGLGALLGQQGRYEEALGPLEAVLEQAPGWAEPRVDLGNVYYALGRADDAAHSYADAVAADPACAPAHRNLAHLHSAAGDHGAAVASLRRALACGPITAADQFALAAALDQSGAHQEAVAAYRQALAADPGLVEAHSNLGRIYKLTGQTAAAAACFRAALAIDPDAHIAHNNLALALQDLGELDESMNCFRALLARRPDFTEAHSNLLCALHYLPDADAPSAAAEHRAWAERHARVPAGGLRAHGNDRAGDRRLRVGYVSADFRTHSVARFIEPLLTGHDRDHFEVFGLSSVTQSDEITQRLRAACDRWQEIHTLDDDAFCELVRDQAIDILVDLSGHTAGNRLSAFARAPAPVQVNHLGYGSTTGLAAMHYRFTDRWLDPPGDADAVCAETLLRLDTGLLCFGEPDDMPPPGASPSIARGAVSFGSFNNAVKINATVIDAWSALLDAVPGSRLLLKAYQLGDTDVRERMLARFSAHGITGERLELLGPLDTRAEHLACYDAIDVCLDTFPYNGATTTCEALWMGIPVVSLALDRHVSRFGASILDAAGLGDLVATSPEGYVSLAVGLAGDEARRGALREQLRARLAASRLMDAPGHVASVERHYRAAWRGWAGGGQGQKR